MVARRANSRRPPGSGHRSEKAPSALSRVTRPSSSPPTSTRNTGVRPSASATKNTARLSAAQTGSCGHRSSPASRSRPSPLARSTSHRPTSRAVPGSPCQIRSQTTSRPSGEQATRPAEDAGSSSSTRRSPLATSIATSSERGLPTSPVSQPQTTVAAVGGDGHVDLVKGPARGRGQRPARRHPLVTRRRGGREQPRLPRPQVVVPVADRVGLEQQRADPGVGAGLVAALVGLQVVGPRVDVGAVHHRAGVAGHPQQVDPGRGGGHRAGLAAAGRQQPQAGHLAVRLGVGGGLGVLAGRGEQQRPVGQEGGVGLAGGGAGQPPRGRLAVRVELPQGAAELLAVRGRGGHRGHQAAAVGGEGQAGHPRKAQVVVEVEGRLGARFGGHSPESRCPAAAAQRHRPGGEGAGHHRPIRVRVPRLRSPPTHQRSRIEHEFESTAEGGWRGGPDPWNAGHRDGE